MRTAHRMLLVFKNHKQWLDQVSLQAFLLLLIYLSQPGKAHAVESIVVHGLLKNMGIVSIDGERHVLKTSDEKVVNGVKLISSNSEQAEVEIHGERQTLRIGKHISTSYKKRSYKTGLSLAPDHMGMYRTGGSINGFQVKFLVDTGATLIAMNEQTAKRIGLDYKLNGTVGQTSTASGVAKAWYLTLDRVKVGKLDLQGVDAAVIQGTHPTEVLLGNSFLNRVDMQRNGKVMELRPR